MIAEEGRRRGSRLVSSLLPLTFSLFILPAFAARPAPVDPWTVLLAGDTDGYLSPCGCTSPMQGGIRRRGSALRSDDPHTVRLENGGFLGGSDRQSVLKAETAAQSLKTSNFDAANFNYGDARIGEGKALTLANLSGHRLISTSLRPSATLPFEAWREAGPFLVGGATSRPGTLAAALREQADPPETAARRLVTEAENRGLAPILLFDGDHDAARALARAVPALRLVTYRMKGHPLSKLEMEGPCALATPGERGKAIIRLEWSGEAFVASSVQMLDPNIPDDSATSLLYGRYLRQVTRENLLEALHPDSKGFSGSASCRPCHAQATEVWKSSRHFHALKTLENDGPDGGHGRDPECVPCHVVGTAQGTLHYPRPAFRSRAATPSLADVGCESCHGAGAAHVSAPRKFVLPKVGAAACRPCHTPENSPNFDFSKYWAKVKH